ncbi:MAG: PDZ domain-containing protein [Chloroflexi bacterium]|nr:PDZ domain-containing protein [Chloroflexota bacterium]
MSDKMRNGIATVLLVVLALTAFVAGYFTNDFVEARVGGTAVADSGDDLALFREAWGLIENNFIGDLPSSKQVAYGAIRGVMQILDDPYTIFIEPVAREEERQVLQGTFGGVGATLARPEEDGSVVLEPISGNPAELAGIQSGDVLIAVDGVEITPDLTVQAVAEMIRGEKGTIVVLTVVHPGTEEEVDIEVERGDILIPSVDYRMIEEEKPIGYIRLTRFSGESSNEVEAALMDLLDQGAAGLVLDMRGNGGGLLDAAIDVADHFVNDGPLMYQQERGQDERVYSATKETLAEVVPLVILIDGGTASAAEIVAGALQDRDRAILIGSSGSFGKGSVQLVFDLSDGSSVHITSSRWFTPDRHQLDQAGLQPDIEVTITQEAIDNGRDEVLNQALQYLIQN